MYHNILDIQIQINQVYSLKNSVLKHFFLTLNMLNFTLHCSVAYKLPPLPRWPTGLTSFAET